jgi:hypothetical protein
MNEAKAVTEVSDHEEESWKTGRHCFLPPAVLPGMNENLVLELQPGRVWRTNNTQQGHRKNYECFASYTA